MSEVVRHDESGTYWEYPDDLTSEVEAIFEENGYTIAQDVARCVICDCLHSIDEDCSAL